MTPRTVPKAATLEELRPLMQRQGGFAEVLAALQRGESGTIDGAWGSSCALAAAALAAEAPAAFVAVVPRLSAVDDFAADLANFLGKTPLVFPAWETLPKERSATDAVFGSRLRILRALASATPGQVIVTCFPSLLQPVPDRDELVRSTRTLRVGEMLDPEELLRWLAERGFERVPAIQLPGEFAMHGGIVDIFPPDALDPYRFEYFGDEIESIRRFDAETQRKLEDVKQVDLTLISAAREGNGQAEVSQGASFLDYLPAESWVALIELPELVEEGKHYLQRLDNPRGFFSVEPTLARCTQFPTVTLAALSASSMETSCHLQIESIERFSSPSTEVVKELAAVVGLDERVLIACHNAGEQERLTELLKETDLPSTGRVELCEGIITRGFRLVAERLIVLSDHELFGRQEIRRGPSRKSFESRAIDSFLELSEGDLVVHLTHGIARYRGMQLLHKGEQSEEHLALEFRDGVRMFVPVSLIHLVQKYVGGTKGTQTLSKIGSSSWERKKRQVAAALVDMASDMIQLQAERDMKPGIAYPPDSHWQQEFEAAFPYVETPDQVRAIADLKEDMQRSRPMDRLICGDVGYGKTEVAMRAAFKAIDSGKQVAVLVPTTVLAEQHYRSFRQRMAEFPFTIEVLSRFKTKGEQQKILEGLKTGGVDLVIGTHRLVQPDVKFSDLGLLIIDEEQRFGVEAKEMLKRLRLEVDVLTLSATPIPRTLHLSLLGIRDISNLQTPPHDRLAIETRISRFDPELIRAAIIRELNRGGQVYFVHNRVYDIHVVTDRLQRIVPEATFGIVHGQMNEHELEETMLGFVAGRIDVLVATTIIESGLDIPNANTILIHEADKYGLADLHQLRGRVGRYKHRAYCYLLLEEGRSVTSAAAKRLKAIEEFTELGAGFRIAMRDLEIRGAGNILGTEQSGHIAAVGYELYCQLLENAVRQLKKEPIRESQHVAVDLPLSAYLPASYVPPGRHKIEVYRKLSRVATAEDLAELADELRDRYGPFPDEVTVLFELKELQILARAWQIDDIHREERFIVFGYRNPRKLRELAQRIGSRLRIVDGRSAYLLLETPDAPPREILATAKALLQSE